MIKALKDDRSTLRTFLGYVGEVAGKAGRPLRERALKDEDEEETMQTINQYLKSLGRRSGIRIGLAKGPREVDDRLAAADATTLEAWLDAAIDARSLRALFTRPH